MGTSATGYVMSDAPSREIRHKLSSCDGPDYASHIFLHTGDIDVRNTPGTAVQEMIDTIDEAMKVFPDRRILVNTLSENIKDNRIRNTVKYVNKAIEEKCQEILELSVIDSKNSQLKDNIHFTYTEYKNIARKVLDSVNYVHI